MSIIIILICQEEDSFDWTKEIKPYVDYKR